MYTSGCGGHFLKSDICNAEMKMSRVRGSHLPLEGDGAARKRFTFIHPYIELGKHIATNRQIGFIFL